MPEGNGRCPIWHTPATSYLVPDVFAFVCDSPRAGGRYWIAQIAMTVLKHRNEQDRALLTSWLVERRRAGEDCPKVYGHDLDSTIKRERLLTDERATNLLVYIRRALPDPADNFEYERQVESSDYYDDHRRLWIVREWEMMAWSETIEPELLVNLLEDLEEKGYLATAGRGTTRLKYRITAQGHEYLQNRIKDCVAIEAVSSHRSKESLMDGLSELPANLDI